VKEEVTAAPATARTMQTPTTFPTSWRYRFALCRHPMRSKYGSKPAGADPSDSYNLTAVPVVGVIRLGFPLPNKTSPHPARVASLRPWLNSISPRYGAISRPIARLIFSPSSHPLEGKSRPSRKCLPDTHMLMRLGRMLFGWDTGLIGTLGCSWVRLRNIPTDHVQEVF
jgi:hypothetical protein